MSHLPGIIDLFCASFDGADRSAVHLFYCGLYAQVKQTEVWVLLDGDRVCGVFDITAGQSPVRPYHVAQIQYLYTHPLFEAHAFKLVKRGFKFSMKHFCEATYVSVPPDSATHRWVAKHGFTVDATILKGPFNHGRQHS